MKKALLTLLIFFATVQTVAQQKFWVTVTAVRQPGQPLSLILKWDGDANTTYKVERSPDLKNWTQLGEVKSTSAGQIQWVDTPTTGRIGFYRVATAKIGPPVFTYDPNPVPGQPGFGYP